MKDYKICRTLYGKEILPSTTAEKDKAFLSLLNKGYSILCSNSIICYPNETGYIEYVLSKEIENIILKDETYYNVIWKNYEDGKTHTITYKTLDEANELLKVLANAPYKTMKVSRQVVKREKQLSTRQGELLKMFPNAKLDEDCVDICPRFIDKDYICPLDVDCKDIEDCSTCKYKYWLEEID